MKKEDVVNACEKFIQLRRASLIGYGPMEERIKKREEANAVWLTIPKRDMKKVPAYVWDFIGNLPI